MPRKTVKKKASKTNQKVDLSGIEVLSLVNCGLVLIFGAIALFTLIELRDQQSKIHDSVLSARLSVIDAVENSRIARSYAFGSNLYCRELYKQSQKRVFKK